MVERARLELALLLIIGIAPFYFNGWYNAWFAATRPGWFWPVEMVTWIFLPALILIVVLRRHLASVTELGLDASIRGRQRRWMVLALVPVVSLLLFATDMLVARWANTNLPVGWPTPQFAYTDMIPPPAPGTRWWHLLAVAHFSVSAGVVEELYYRALFHRLFSEGRLASLMYVAISATVFAGAHWEGGLPRLLEAMVVGILAAGVFRVTRNLWPLIIAHAITDYYWFAGGF